LIGSTIVACYGVEWVLMVIQAFAILLTHYAYNLLITARVPVFVVSFEFFQQYIILPITVSIIIPKVYVSE
jgi:hypothetical protein